MSPCNDHRIGSAGYRIGRLFRANARLGDRLFKIGGLSRGQVPVFMAVLHEPGRSQKKLASELHVDAAAIARALLALEQRGLVRREENPGCRRDKRVFPTPEAEVLLPGLLELLDRHNELLLADFTPEERAEALRVLDRITANVERALEEESR